MRTWLILDPQDIAMPPACSLTGLNSPGNRLNVTAVLRSEGLLISPLTHAFVSNCFKFTPRNLWVNEVLEAHIVSQFCTFSRGNRWTLETTSEAGRAHRHQTLRPMVYISGCMVPGKAAEQTRSLCRGALGLKGATSASCLIDRHDELMLPLRTPLRASFSMRQEPVLPRRTDSSPVHQPKDSVWRRRKSTRAPLIVLSTVVVVLKS